MTLPGNERRTSLDATAIGLLILLSFLLGLGQVAIKVANDGISPVLQAGLRSFGSAVVLWLWCQWRGIKLFERDGTLWPGLVAGLLFAAEFGLLYPGLALTTAARGVIFLYTSPFVVAIGAHFLIQGDRLTFVRSAGLVAAFLGVIVAFTGRSAAEPETALIGDLLCLGAAISWGAFTVWTRITALARVLAEKVVFIMLVVSGFVLTGLSPLIGEPGFTSPTPLHWWCFAYTVFFVGFVVFTTQYWLLTRYPASRVMAALFLTPVFGVMCGGLLLGEPVTWHVLAALTLVAAGIWLVNQRPVAPKPA